MYKYFLRALFCLCAAGVLQAQMTPSAPVKNFRFPRFGDNGFTQWVLQGGQGIYDSEEQIRVKDMALRVYSGDERMALEMTLKSPAATLRVAENRAYSESSIEIVGANFKITGIGWEWDGDSKEIEVKDNVAVEFTQDLADALSGAGAPSDAAAGKKTVIWSKNLVLQTTETEYRFEFTDSVHAVSEGMDLKSEVLIAVADAPEGRDSGAPEVSAGQADAVRQVIARDSVVIEQGDYIVRAGEAEFFPKENSAILTGLPQIETTGVYLSGDTIRSRAGEMIITGSEATGRAQMILSRAGGLGIQGSGAISSDTIILSDQITLQERETENHFFFEGAVDVMSGAVQMASQTMTVRTAKADADNAVADAASDEGANVGQVQSLEAEGGVRIEQGGQVATSERVVFHPSEERAELIGQPRVTNGEAVVIGERMELQPGLAIVIGSDISPVVVTLPTMPDLGYAGFGSDRTPRADPAEAEIAPKPVNPVIGGGSETETVITSRHLRMIEAPDLTLFRFSEDVQVLATNLEATCDLLEVTAKEKAVSAAGSASSHERLDVEMIEAFHNVEIRQTGRVATASKATILPEAGRLVLEGEAKVVDDRGTVTGHRMTLLQGERRALVEGGGPEGDRARITLPAMPGR